LRTAEKLLLLFAMSLLLPLLLAALTTDEAPYWLFQGHGLPMELVPYRVLWSTPGRSIVDVSTPDKRAAVEAGIASWRMRRALSAVPVEEPCRGFDAVPLPLERAELPEQRDAARRSLPDSGLTRTQLQALVDKVDGSRYFSTIDALAGFGSRYSLTGNVVAARDYIAAELAAAGLTVTRPQFTYNGTTQQNIVGTITGSLLPDQFVVVGAHYDSLPRSATNAPGAEDNASGTAAVIELARIFADERPQRTIVFVAFAAEEQGLVGSTRYVQSLTSTQRANLAAALTMDMIAYTSDSELDVLLETSAFANGVADIQAAAAAEFTTLAVYRSLNPFGSDHVPFLNQSLPATLAIQNEWDTYPHYHRNTDTIAQVSQAQGTEVVKMQAAALGILANPQPAAATVRDWWTIY
jgi:hypothetical protein